MKSYINTKPDDIVNEALRQVLHVNSQRVQNSKIVLHILETYGLPDGSLHVPQTTPFDQPKKSLADKLVQSSVQFGWLDVFKFMSNIIDINNGQLFNLAIHNWRENIINYFLDKGINPSINNDLLIRKACSKGEVLLLKRLLKDGRPNPTSANNDSFKEACRNGHFEIVKLLLNSDFPIEIGVDNHFAKRLVDKSIKRLDDEIKMSNNPKKITHKQDKLSNYIKISCLLLDKYYKFH